MNKNFKRKDHPIRYEIVRLKRYCAWNSEKIKLISQGLLAISLPLATMYGMTKIPACIDAIRLSQLENRERAHRRFEEMSASERDKIWTQEQQDAIFKHIKKVREEDQYLYKHLYLKRMERIRSRE